MKLTSYEPRRLDFNTSSDTSGSSMQHSQNEKLLNAVLDDDIIVATPRPYRSLLSKKKFVKKVSADSKIQVNTKVLTDIQQDKNLIIIDDEDDIKLDNADQTLVLSPIFKPKQNLLSKSSKRTAEKSPSGSQAPVAKKLRLDEPKDSSDVKLDKEKIKFVGSKQIIPLQDVTNISKINCSDSDRKSLKKDINASPVKHKKTLPLKTQKDVLISKNYIEKVEILRFLQSVISVDLSKDVLTDIVYKSDGSGKFTVVGRSKVMGSSTKQMRHVIPYSFVEKLISYMVKNSESTKDLFAKLSKAILLFVNDNVGFCFNSLDLKNSPYKSISKSLTKNPEIISKSLFNEDITYFFVDASHSKMLFDTPTKKEKAKKEYSIKNKEFIQASLVKLENAIDDQDSNTSTIASEALARYMFILFNQQKHAAFPKEGNTLEYEIRLYKSIAEAESPKNSNYKVVTSREIKEIINEGRSEEISKCIRIVNCEGSRSKEIYKGLINLSNIIKEHNSFDNTILTDAVLSLFKMYNEKYNFYLKLANVTPDITKYNNDLDSGSFKENIIHQTAKLLYLVFDFKALEDDVFVPNISDDSIKVYNSATGSKTSKYSIKNGHEYRKIHKNEATGYNDDVIFRTSKTKLDILAHKAVQHAYISLMPFNSFIQGFKAFTFLQPNQQSNDYGFIKMILNSFTNLVKLDYALNADQLNVFKELISEDFNKILELEASNESMANYDIKLTGENFIF